MPMTLEEFDAGVGHHLREISTSARYIVAHANAMLARPDFGSIGEDELVRCENVLAQALGRIRHAAETIRSKPVDR